VIDPPDRFDGVLPDVDGRSRLAVDVPRTDDLEGVVLQ
jgi:hypothetical protein